jgi:hypothetical protein
VAVVRVQTLGYTDSNQSLKRRLFDATMTPPRMYLRTSKPNGVISEGSTEASRW